MPTIPRTETLHALATEGAGGQTAWFDVGDAREALVRLKVTDAPAAFTAFLQAPDGENESAPVDLPYVALRVHEAVGADTAGNSTSDKRNLVTQITSPQTVDAIYAPLAAGKVRLRWIGGGATFEAFMDLK